MRDVKSRRNDSGGCGREGRRDSKNVFVRLRRRGSECPSLRYYSMLVCFDGIQASRQQFPPL